MTDIKQLAIKHGAKVMQFETIDLKVGDIIFDSLAQLESLLAEHQKQLLDSHKRLEEALLEARGMIGHEDNIAIIDKALSSIPEQVRNINEVK